MSRQMVITVGTSLFHSATWGGELPREVEGYDDWTGDSCPTAGLRACEREIGEGLKRALTVDNAEDWSRCLAPELHDSGRFSAELSTLVLLARQDGHDLPELLRSYEAIHVVAESRPSGDEILARIAAVHLACYLDTVAGQPVAQLYEIPGIGSVQRHRLTEALKALQEFVLRLTLEDFCLELDLVLTGGFKVYGYLLGPLSYDKETVRLIYTHEQASELIVLQGNEMRIGDGPGIQVKAGALHDD